MEIHNNSSISNSKKDALRLLTKGLALSCLIVVQLLTIVVFSRDGNNYALATIDKHARLAMDDRQKIVLLGGSNLAYGMDSARIETALGPRVVNMGMNGYLGVRFMLEEAKPYLRGGDIATISLEYDSYFKSTDGTGADLLMIVKSRPKSLAYLAFPHQWLMVAQAVPFAAQQKTLRLMGSGIDRIQDWVQSWNSNKPANAPSPEVAGSTLVAGIESRAGFEAHGDLISHLGVQWTNEREQGVDLTATPFQEDVFQTLVDFTAEMKGKGVDVVIFPCPVLDIFYRQHRDSIERLFKRLKDLNLNVLAPPGDYVFEDKYLFDTVYHLNSAGRRIRTDKIVSALRPRVQPAKAAR